eukprot:scaffold10166_cov146-Isochrysis_galbana.AAC.7
MGARATLLGTLPGLSPHSTGLGSGFRGLDCCLLPALPSTACVWPAVVVCVLLVRSWRALDERRAVHGRGGAYTHFYDSKRVHVMLEVL